MNELYNLKTTLCEELEQYGAKGDLSAGDLDVVDKLAHAIKNLIKIIDACDEEYSGEMGNRSNRSYRGSNSNRSYRNYSNRRDSMGRYAGDYASAAADMADQLRDLMEQAPDEKTRRDIERMVQKMEKM